MPAVFPRPSDRKCDMPVHPIKIALVTGATRGIGLETARQHSCSKEDFIGNFSPKISGKDM